MSGFHECKYFLKNCDLTLLNIFLAIVKIKEKLRTIFQLLNLAFATFAL